MVTRWVVIPCEHFLTASRVRECATLSSLVGDGLLVRSRVRSLCRLEVAPLSFYALTYGVCSRRNGVLAPLVLLHMHGMMRVLC